MTDYSRVKKELLSLSGLSNGEADKYESVIKNAISCIESILKDKEKENDVRIIYLCAIKSLYEIMIIRNALGEEVISFTAGDISFSKPDDLIQKLKSLMSLALNNCAELVVSKGFCFKVV